MKLSVAKPFLMITIPLDPRVTMVLSMCPASFIPISAASSTGSSEFLVMETFRHFAISFNSARFGVMKLMADQNCVSNGFVHTAISVGSKKTVKENYLS